MILTNIKFMPFKSFNHEGHWPHLSFTLYLLLLIFFCISCPLSVTAQQTFTEHLTRHVAGEGTVILHQDAEIEALVNNPSKLASTHRFTPLGKTATDSVATADPTKHITNGHRTYTVGYRIQVYAGGNNRQSKAEAHRMANLVRSTFGDIPVYTKFNSPRWVCQAGDFKTREEANEQLQKMRATSYFGEASIVKSKIAVYY